VGHSESGHCRNISDIPVTVSTRLHSRASVNSKESAVSELPKYRAVEPGSSNGRKPGIVSNVVNPYALSLGQSLTKEASPADKEESSVS